MGLERYLCVGGGEVANPNRTLAYLRNLGNRCLPTPPGDGCCTCPDWSPQPCAITLDAGLQRQGPLEECIGLWGIDGVNEAATWLLIELYQYPLEDCPPPVSPPPLPAPDDPGWQFGGAVPFSSVTFPLAGCGDPPPLPESCGFFRYTVVDGASGEVAPFYAWLDPNAGISGVRFSADEGATWGGPARQLYTQPAPCPGGVGATIVRVQLEDGVGWVTIGLPGMTGPFSINMCSLEDPTPDVTPMPPLDDPAWDCELAVLPEWMPMPFGGDLSMLPTGWYMGTITDGDGLTFTGGWRWDGVNLAYTTDGGATWGPPPETGTIWLEEPPVVAGFVSPAIDDAPWYDSAVPESGDVLGVWLEEVRLGASYQRDARPRLWGSSLGPARQPGRELTLVGWVYTRSEAATAYARNWLFEALQGGACFGGNCDLPDAEVYTHCDPETAGAGSRLLKRVGLTGWDPDTEPTFPRACGFKFEAVLTAEVPHLITAPFSTVERVLTEGVETCTVCSPCPELEPAPIACGCMAAELREVPAGDVAACYCPPVQVHRTFVATLSPRLWSDAVAVITIDAGDPDVPGGPGLSNLRIRGWVNPVGLPAPASPEDPNPFECQDPCLDVEVSCVPERGRLIIDGATRKATLEVAGQRIGAYGYLSSGGGRRFAWPEVSCHGLMLCIDAAVGQTPEAARVKVELVTRERG